MDIDRLRNIADQIVSPEQSYEVAFLAGYLAGSQGVLLMSVCIEINTDKLDRNELDHFMFGYCMGQRDLEEAFSEKINGPLH